MALKNRPIMFWTLGSLCIFLAMAVLVVAGGESLLAYLIGFILVLMGGMLWISIMHMEEPA